MLAGCARRLLFDVLRMTYTTNIAENSMEVTAVEVNPDAAKLGADGDAADGDGDDDGSGGEEESKQDAAGKDD